MTPPVLRIGSATKAAKFPVDGDLKFETVVELLPVLEAKREEHGIGRGDGESAWHQVARDHAFESSRVADAAAPVDP